MQLNLVADKRTQTLTEEQIYHAHGDEVSLGYGDDDAYGFIDYFYEDEACTKPLPFMLDYVYRLSGTTDYFQAKLDNEGNQIYVKLDYTPRQAQFVGYLNYYIYSVYEGYRGINIEYGFSPEDLFEGLFRNNTGELELGSYNGVDTTRGVHFIKLNRNLNEGESINFKWKNGSELRITNEAVYAEEDEEGNKGLYPVGYKTRIYRSAGGAYNEIGAAIEVIRKTQITAKVPENGCTKIFDDNSEQYEIDSENYTYRIYRFVNNKKEAISYEDFRIVSQEPIYERLPFEEVDQNGKPIIVYHDVDTHHRKVVVEINKMVNNTSEKGAFLFKDMPNRCDKTDAHYFKEI